MPLHFVRDDITRIEADAIVNAAKNSLLGGGGVDGAIHAAAGPELLAECRTIGGCPTGEARITRGYRLPAKYVIHTVGPVYRGGKHGEEALLRACYRNSLSLAAQYGLHSVAFPLISAGVYGYPKDEAIAVAIDEIRRFLFADDTDMDVTLVFFDKNVSLLSKKLLGELRERIDDAYAEAHYNENARVRRRAQLKNLFRRKHGTEEAEVPRDNEPELPEAYESPAPTMNALEDFETYESAVLNTDELEDIEAFESAALDTDELQEFETYESAALDTDKLQDFKTYESQTLDTDESQAVMPDDGSVEETPEPGAVTDHFPAPGAVLPSEARPPEDHPAQTPYAPRPSEDRPAQAHYAPRPSARPVNAAPNYAYGAPVGRAEKAAGAAKPFNVRELQKQLETLDEGFTGMLLRKIDERGMTDAECYKKANIDRKLFSKIRSNPAYRPKKTTVFAFAIALELSLPETEALLKKAGYAFSGSSKSDIIVRYYIEHGRYDIFDINEALYEFDQALLGA